MDEFIFNALSKYYDVLGKTGYMSYINAVKLLVLIFYRDFVYHDYRGLISREDYHQIELALNCLYGTTCLIPYPDYLKMGKLNIGSLTELASRVKALEDTNVLKVVHQPNPEDHIESDIVILANTDEEE